MCLLLLKANTVLERIQEEILADEISRFFHEKDFIELNQNWLIINHKQTIKRMLNAYGDDIKRQILILTAETPLTVSELIEKTNHPTTTLYRAINDLISDSLILHAGYDKSSKKTSTRYLALIRNMKINIGGNHISILIKINRGNTTDERNSRQIL